MPLPSDVCATGWAGVLQLATDAIGISGRHRLIGLPTLLLDVPISTEADLAFVTALAAAFKVEDLDLWSVARGPDGASTGGVHGEFVNYAAVASGTDRGSGAATRNGQGRRGRAGGWPDRSPGVRPLSDW